MYDETGADDRPATNCGKVISALSRISGKPGDTGVGNPADRRKRAAGDMRADPDLCTKRGGHGFGDASRRLWTAPVACRRIR
jgi:hypothetical protein